MCVLCEWWMVCAAAGLESGSVRPDDDIFDKLEFC